VPWDLAQGVRQRVALLPAAGQEVLGAAAVVGRHASRALLLAVAGQPEEAVLAGLEAACHARLLAEEGDNGYAFAHDVIREVVEADQGTARRALLHRKVAAALERAPRVSPEVLAYHYARGGATHKALVYLEQAGDQAWAQRAPDAAERHYQEVVDRLDTLGQAQEAARVREKLGEVLFQTGRYGALIAALERAGETFRAVGDGESLGRVAARMAEADKRQGTPEEGLARLQPLLEHLERSEPAASMAELYMWWGLFQLEAGRYQEHLAAVERAATLARARGDQRTLVRVSWGRANALQLLGRLEEALRVNEQILPLAEAVGELQVRVTVARNQAFIHTLRGAFADSRRYLEQSFASAGQLANPAVLSLTFVFRGWLAILTGEWPGARADLDQALALSRQVDRSWFSAYPLIWRARLSLVEGDGAAATAALQEALALAEQRADIQALRWASGVMAEIDILEGRAEAAQARLAPLLDRPGLQECDVTMLLPVLAWAQLELGQVEQAAGTAEQVLARARPEEMRLALVETLWVQALIALRREQWEQAAGSVEEGLALALAMPYPYAEGRLLHVGGLVHGARSEPEAARQRLEEARSIFARLGARMDLERVEQDLSALSQNDGRGRSETTVSDAQWAQVQALLPPPARTGRRRADDRRTLEAILYVQRTGCAWAALPAAYGDEATAHRRLRQWQADGVWARIAAIVRTVPGSG
jgi:tetratricopeptide (TPR) repeat protein